MPTLPQTTPNLTRHPQQQPLIHHHILIRKRPHDQQASLPTIILAHSMQSCPTHQNQNRNTINVRLIVD